MGAGPGGRRGVVRSGLVLGVWLAVCFGAAVFGAQFMPGAWYAGLRKPAWNPPNWIFGPVWTALYAMMAVAAWLVWRRVGWRVGARPLGTFLVQLILNAIWSAIFFGLQRPAFAFAEIVLLWVAILATVLGFRRVSPVAAWLLVPYLAWVSFAAVLNFSLWRLNS